ncbi:MAG: hypothetical protein Q7I89_07185 [Syntrophales bacterium]|nr:hypothetical protein [Syntrophales bacterium]
MQERQTVHFLVDLLNAILFFNADAAIGTMSIFSIPCRSGPFPVRLTSDACDYGLVIPEGSFYQDIQVSESCSNARDEKQDGKEKRGPHLPVQPIADKEPSKDQKNESESDTASVSHLNK